MAYIGKTPSQATRSRFYYTATGGETSLSGADDNGNTLVFSDGNYVDVMLNGVTLVAGTDYNTTTANTIGGLTALTASDIVEIVVYDTFAVFGGDVQGDLNIQNGTLSAQQGLVVDNDGATVATFDRATSDGTIAEFQKDGSAKGSIGVASDLTIYIDGGSQFAGLQFGGNGSTEGRITPRRNGASQDAQVNLGTDSLRFKNLYLSGGVYLGGTGAANYLDDYEEGTFTPLISYSDGDPTRTTASGSYVKVGSQVFAHGTLGVSSRNGFTGTVRISLPFAVADAVSGTVIDGTGGFNYWSGIATAVSQINLAPNGGQSYATGYYTAGTGNTIIPSLDAATLDTFNCRFWVIYRTDS